MPNIDEPDYKLLAARDKLTPEEFAALATGLNPEYISTIKQDAKKKAFYEKYLSLLSIVNSWEVLYSAHPFWYIDKLLKTQSLSILPKEFSNNLVNNFLLSYEVEELNPETHPYFYRAIQSHSEYSEKLRSLEANKKKTNESLFGVPLQEFPMSLQIAVDIYYQCWHKLPQNMRAPSMTQIGNYVEKYHSLEATIDTNKGEANAAFKRLYQLSKPNSKKPKNPQPNSKTTDSIPFKPLRERKL